MSKNIMSENNNGSQHARDLTEIDEALEGARDAIEDLWEIVEHDCDPPKDARDRARQ